MTESAPMSLPDALREMRRPCATVDKMEDGIVVALWPYGTNHGGTSMCVTLDREMALALREQLARALHF